MTKESLLSDSDVRQSVIFRGKYVDRMGPVTERATMDSLI